MRRGKIFLKLSILQMDILESCHHLDPLDGHRKPARRTRTMGIRTKDMGIRTKDMGTRTKDMETRTEDMGITELISPMET